MKRYLSVAFGTSALTESHTSSQAEPPLHPHPPKCVGGFYLGMHGGQDRGNLVFLGLGSLLVRRRVSDENVNTELPWDEHICIRICSLSCSKTEDAQPVHISLMRRDGGGQEVRGQAGQAGGERRREGGGERREVLFEISCSSPAPTVCR